MIWYSKPYKSRCGLPAHWVHVFDVKITFKKKSHNKMLGYWNIYYDGYYHFFSIYPIQFHWCKLPELIHSKQKTPTI